MTNDNEVLNELNRIIELITPILIDIRQSTSKRNIQTNSVNKKQLQQIALKLKLSLLYSLEIMFLYKCVNAYL